MATINGDYLTIAQAAKELDLEVSTIYQYLHSGAIKAERFGAGRMINRTECERYKKQRKPRGNPSFKKLVSKRKK